jgi:hypothetical protein
MGSRRIALRVAGILTTLAGLLVMIVDHSGTGLVTAIAGVMLWLAGHWHFAVKHHHFRSPLARRIFAQLPPTLDPTRPGPAGTRSTPAKTRPRAARTPGLQALTFTSPSRVGAAVV